MSGQLMLSSSLMAAADHPSGPAVSRRQKVLGLYC